jgi:hypothetical protein
VRQWGHRRYVGRRISDSDDSDGKSRVRIQGFGGRVGWR